MSAEIAVVILAGGRATRLPGKLERSIGERPMLLELFERLRGEWPVYVATSGSLAPVLDAELACTVIVDRFPGRGPLAALVCAAGELRERRIFAVAGDMPMLSRATLETLDAAWQPGDEALCASDAQRTQPLAALYDRAALVREGIPLLREGRSAMRDLLARLRVRRLPVESSLLLNVNTPADFDLALSTRRTLIR